MMERRRALKLPFHVNKEDLVSWTAFTGCRLKHHDSQNKNGSVLFDHKQGAMVRMEMDRRKPCLILTDVLKTELGKTHMERIKSRDPMENKGQMSSKRKESCRKEEPVRERRSVQRDASRSSSPKHNQSPTSLPPQRSRLRRGLHVEYEEVKNQSKDVKGVLIGKDNDADNFAEVVDCGLSVSWKPAEDVGDYDEFSKWSVPEKEQHSLKRKQKESGPQCNKTSIHKRSRQSVLRFNREDVRDGRPDPVPVCDEESEEDRDLESLDRSIVQFTVEGDDGTLVLVPVSNHNVEDADIIGTSGQSLSSSRDSGTKTRDSSEPIVLSSDDENTDITERCSPAVNRKEDGVIQEVVDKQPESSDINEVQVVHLVDQHPVSEVFHPTLTVGISCMGLAFSTLYSGGYQAKANGNIVMGDHKIIIPVRDRSGQVEVMLSFERKELRRYSVWEQQEMEMRELQFKDDEEPFPVAVLLFVVSETAAAAVQRDLSGLCVRKDRTSKPGKASPFILLTLRDPLEGMEGALLRSLLEIDCLNSLACDQSVESHSEDKFSFWEDGQTPVLSLDDSVKLIGKTGLDLHLLSLLGQESTDPEFITEQDASHSDIDEINKTYNQLEAEPREKAALEIETESEEDKEMQLKPEEEHNEEEVEQHLEKRKEESTNIYTLCHMRSKGSYSVSLCKPDSSWSKYRHQGLAQRLIQYPPPPAKGGITVTMEDLQCLDSGQFLNDVIIDFYLKYLFHNASAAVAERSHIFSSFFYKQLTRRDNASEGGTSDSCQRQRRHQRVKTWTRHVDIFQKDFLFVPVNQEAHWYLVVICFPGLDEPTFEPWTGPDSKVPKSHSGTDESQDQAEVQESKSPNNHSKPFTLNRTDSTDMETEKAQEESTKDQPPGQVNCTEKTFQKTDVYKMPCILIMDSLKLSLHERVFKLLRDYLQSEWEVRRGSSRDFGPDQMKSSHCRVPLQDNSSDCGLYLLQYVESFLKDPVVHFDLPLHLQRWFPRQEVRRKRDEIRDLVLYLYRRQNVDENR
ncbi:sentrin-specific protease 7 isoform X2 [Echeneis naucrates]|uniref:sentrin-specific protease 7 isoform X2 n=1 Tax=Echeneis naucrates TaxID=173247 RepID=UPI0011142642|nr:sentrin-specific protease 7-like isoform X2 [Echeneis naucrates]